MSNGAERGLSARALLERLVAIPSPTGDEAAAVAFLQQQARADGFTVETDEVGNFIAHTAGTGPRIVCLGHIDTVPGGPACRRDGDVLWGRGSVDAKASLVTAYIAARERMDACITVVGAVGEEGDSRGARAWLEAQQEAPDAVVIGEPSGWDAVTIGYKGIVRGTATHRSTPAHGGAPTPNACDTLVAAWHEATGMHTGHGFDDVTLRLDDLRTRHDHVQEAALDFQVRTPPRTRPGEVIAVLQEVLGPVEIRESIPAHAGTARGPLAAAFRQAIRAAGATPRMLRKTGTADLNLVAMRWPDVPMVAYGPGDSDLDHAPDERLDLRELDRAVTVLGAALDALQARVPA